MKKICAAVLALALAVSMGVPAFASEDRATVTENKGSAGKDIYGAYENPAGEPATVISTDVKWDTMTFIYQDGGMEWDPSSHQDVGTPGAWDPAKKTVTVINHSNTGLHISTQFKPSSGITGSLSRTHLWLDSAVGTATEQAPQGSVQLGISGGKVSKSGKIGTLTVTIEQDSRQPLTDPSVLTSGNLLGAYELQNDMTLTGKIQSNSSANYAMINMNGHKLTAGFGDKAFEIKSNLTLRDGMIENTSPGQLVLEATYPGDDAAAEITVDNCALQSAYSVLSVQQNTRVILHNSYLTAGAGYPAIVMDSRGGATLILSGTILLHDAAIENTSAENTVECLAGEYDFDPTPYVDADIYTVVAPSGGNAYWIVLAK